MLKRGASSPHRVHTQEESAPPRPALGGRLRAAFMRLVGLFTPGPSLAWVTPALAQGPAPRRSHVAALARAGLHSVLDLRAEAADDAALMARHGLRYRRVPMVDLVAPGADVLKEAVEWALSEMAADRRVLVHCQAGAGRSPFVACAVLLRMGYDLQQAYQTVRRLRPEMTLSDEQVAALQEYARSGASG